ncbi:uncharacterized protein LOC133876156 [Alnus glutinosa]|uniref:uncharacterized protein LOC133876156 n=1 Tax=Alnus glutinosa TaxID=3517 RepID=UPI002D76A929|nr:uncharacterized protein LOC133876156 [Alnus glutinosa]
MGKPKTLDLFFKKKDESHSKVNTDTPLATEIEALVTNERPSKCPRIQPGEMDATTFQRDPGLCPQIWEFPVDLQDEMRSAYINTGPCQPILPEYPFSGEGNNRRRFQASWFNTYSTWLEYSKSKDAIFCLQCYVFAKKSTGRPGLDAFIVKGFNNWKKSRHIDKLVEKQTLQETENNRLRLKTSVDSVQWLAFQACAFRGHDERSDSKNQGNFIELIKLLATYNDDVSGLVLENAPKNAKYTSPKIQKEILHIIANKVRDVIRKEIGDAKFCILIAEARDESKREQMAIILRFVDKDGFIRERFFHVVHVNDTIALTLKKNICAVLSRYNLQIEIIRGQGYDGGSNMRGEWNGLQALFLRDCPYAYYMHYKLQLALVAASREAKHIHQFFIQLASIINIVGGSSKHHDELQSAQATEIESLIVSNKIETGKGANQIVINNISKEGANYSQRGDAEAAYMVLTSFEFVFILHLMNDIMGLTNMLCQTLQQKSIDILNAASQVSTTQLLIQQRREDGWEPLLATVKSFCEENDIDIPDMNAHYSRARGRSHHQDEGSLTTVEHHFRVDIFTAAIDFQLQELKNRFGEQAVELLTLSVALSPKDAYKSFKIDDICKLAKKFYPKDFNKQERFCLKFQLEHYKLDVPKHSDFQNMSTLSELCRGLAHSEKSKIYPLINKLIRLVLTLLVSTSTTERAFSAMKLIKTRLRSRMEDEFLAGHMVVYIEKEIAKNFTSEMIMDEFYSISNRRRA